MISSQLERNIKLVLEYDGTDWHGWQVQNNARTVQGEVERALSVIIKQPVRVTGASRTDAGVHARGQVCNFHTASSVPIERWPAALNSNLAAGVVVVSAAEVSQHWHARIHALGKRYSYTINTRTAPLAIGRRYALHYPHSLDVQAMQDAANHLIGEHDFASFQAAGSFVKDTVRSLHNLQVKALGDHRLQIVAIGNGFLYHMVRIIVGTLLLVGNGKLPPEEMRRILRAKDRTQAGPTAPAHGLCLEEVYYM
ncbi:MAG: tRNA pseudouridine(38-40) synthase TruA [Bacillota bacterium]|jgi:tRNA pseudouridine38-40 synthase